MACKGKGQLTKVDAVPGEESFASPEINAASNNIQCRKLRPIAFAVGTLREYITVVAVICPAVVFPAREPIQ